MKTQLNIYVYPETDCRFLSIADRSVYNSDLPVEDPVYIITLPGVDTAVHTAYTPNKTITLNSTMLGLCTEELCCLDDGIYIIKQQICPHDKLWEEYYHLRTVMLDERIDKLRCAISNGCIKKGLKEQIEEVEFWSKQARSAVEVCGLKDKGATLYKEAKRLIDKIELDCGC